MIRFPIDDDSMVAVIEPGNINRLKSGKPLTVRLPNGSSVLICYTPDAVAFAERLGFGQEFANIQPKEVLERTCNISAEKLDAMLKECLALPEVER